MTFPFTNRMSTTPNQQDANESRRANTHGKDNIIYCALHKSTPQKVLQIN